ncbi:alpha/beta-hydrolase [Pyrenochaeta sp. DS3sAY3a]|nr:alpha/beta-hydrolase [Pyrenochaeta sp. DS3sAY3a]
MPQSSNEIVIPRPGAVSGPPQPPIAGPDERIFTETFGKLLPEAKFLKTAHGTAAFYEILPLSSLSTEHSLPTLDRVLFIHGVQTPALGMLPLARALHKSFPQAHFVLVDLWGHGLSDTPILPHDMELFLRMFDRLLDQLEWPSAHIVGFSFGASLTTGYVSSRPSRVQSFVLIAPAGLIRSADFTAEEQAHLQGDDEIAARRWVVEFLEGGDLVVPEDWKKRVDRGEVVAQAVKEWQLQHHPGHLASVVAMFRDGGALDNHLGFIKAAGTGTRALVVLGERDGLSSSIELKELGFTEITVVRHAGHGVVRENILEVAESIQNFWPN